MTETQKMIAEWNRIMEEMKKAHEAELDRIAWEKA